MHCIQKSAFFIGLLLCGLVFIPSGFGEENPCDGADQAMLGVFVANVVAPQDSDMDAVDADEKLEDYFVVLNSNIIYLDAKADEFYNLYLEYLSIGNPLAQSAWEAYENFARERDYLIDEKNHWVEFKIAMENIRNAPAIFNGGMTHDDFDGPFSSLSGLYEAGCWKSASLPVWDTMPADSAEHTFILSPKFGDDPVIFLMFDTKAVSDETGFASFRDYVFLSPYALDAVAGAEPDDITITIDGVPWAQSENGSLADAENDNEFTLGEPHRVVVQLRSSIIDGSKFPSWAHDATMDMTLFSFDFILDYVEFLDAANLGPCMECAPCPTAGNPINFSTGNKFEVERDFRLPGPGLPMGYARHYNSRNEIETELGYGWTGSFSESVREEGGRIVLTRANGREVFFQDAGDGLTFHSLIDEVRTVEIVVGGYALTEPDGTRMEFDAAGRLTRVSDRNGNFQSVAYANGRLDAVADNFGRRIEFFFTVDGRLESIGTPAGSFSYDHSAEGNLIRATRPDGTFRSYEYADPHDPHNLTGIVDEAQIPYAVFGYDDKDRAVRSENIGGTNAVDVAYHPDLTRTVVDARNHSATFSLEAKHGMGRVRSSSGSGCGTCPSATGANFVTNRRFQPVVVADAKGNTTEYAYDDRGNVLSMTEAKGAPEERTTEFAWHAEYNLPLTVVRPSASGGTVTDKFEYDANGNLLSLRENYGTTLERTTTFSWDGYGRMTSIDGPRGEVTDAATFTYYPADQGGNLHTVVNGKGHVTTFEDYNEFGRPRTVVDANNVTTTFVYDAMGRVKSRTAAGFTTAYDYDAVGRLKKITLPGSREISYDYTAAGLLEKVSDDAGNYISYGYDAEGNPEREEYHDAGGTLRRYADFVHDAENRLERIAYPGGFFEQYGYDDNDNMTSFRDGNGKATGYDYDALNRLIKLTQPGTIETLFGYDGMDNLKSVTDANTNATAYGYDDRGDLETLDSPDAGLEDFTYDAAGNVASRTDANNVTATFTHDALNRPTGVFFPDSSQNVAYGYDSGAYGKGRLTSSSDSSGSASYQYNALGQATRETRSMDGRTYATAYAYDSATADLKTVTYPSGLAVTYSRDGNGRVTGIAAGGRTIAENVSYMPFGPAKGMTLGPVAVSRTFDQRYLTTGIAAGSLMNLTYTRDGAGNVKSVDGLPRPVLIPGTADYAHTPGTNRLESSSGRGARSYTYDNVGNTVSDGIRDFVYDQRNRLIRVEIGGANVAEYAYDAFHRRVKKMVGGETTYFHYDADGLLICETDASGNVFRDYVYLNGEPVAMREAGDWYWFLNDHLGTPRIMVDASGAVVWKAAYLPFGRAIVGLADVENNLRFPGQYFDAESGLHYNWHRYYDPEIGRYLRPDPIGLDGGINLFAYVNGDPINWVDIDGLYRSHWVLRALIPGQVAWDNALTAFENGDLGSAALHAGAMVGEQVLAAYMGKLSSMSGGGCPVRSAPKSGDDLVDMYRAVGPDELADIQKTGKFNPGPFGSEGKYFTTSGQQASTYAKEAVTKFGDAPYTIVKTQGPRSLINAADATVTVEKGIKATVVPNQSLNQLTPEVLKYSPLP